MFYQLAQPTRFLHLTSLIRPYCGWLTVALLSFGLWLALVQSPMDYQHFDAVRIMYVHVPASWLALMTYALMALSHIVGHIWKHPLCDLTALAVAPIGLCFTLLSLITGSLWGKPMWGAWWVWDARLTSMFILLLLYGAYLIMVHSYDDKLFGLRASGVLCMIGAINLPIIKWSVNWWNTLHQPASITKLSAPSLHQDFMAPLLIMASGYVALLLWLGILRIEREVLLRKLHIVKYKHRHSFSKTTL